MKKKLTAVPEIKYFPIRPTMGWLFPARVPWSLAEEAWSQYSVWGPSVVSLEYISSTGEWSPAEFAQYLAGVRAKCDEDLRKLIALAWARVSLVQTEIGRLQERIAALEADNLDSVSAPWVSLQEVTPRLVLRTGDRDVALHNAWVAH